MTWAGGARVGTQARAALEAERERGRDDTENGAGSVRQRMQYQVQLKRENNALREEIAQLRLVRWTGMRPQGRNAAVVQGRNATECDGTRQGRPVCSDRLTALCNDRSIDQSQRLNEPATATSTLPGSPLRPQRPLNV